MGIGYGTTYPAVANTIEKYEIVTVTSVGKAGSQTALAADAKAGDTSIRLRSGSSVSVGDKITLDIDSKDHGIDIVTVKDISTQAATDGGGRGGGGGGMMGGRGGRGGMGGNTIELAEPLKFNHAANIPVSVWGTGITFEPATKFAHSSNEPVLPLNTSITLDKALDNDHEIEVVVHSEKVTTEGFQGKPNQWFGGPAISNAGNIVLRNANGLVSDSLNFGGLVDPWAAEGYQDTSPGSGCSAPAPSAGGRGGFGGRGGQATAVVSRSTGRFPDGADTDSNCRDFMVQNAGIIMSANSDAGSNNIKVDSVSGLSAGQTITIDSGENRESAVIATVGTAGATTVSTATEAGATEIPVANTSGFSAGQTITIDNGANSETATIASVTGGRGNRGGRGGGMMGGRGGRGGGMMAGASITVSSPLKFAHAADVQVSGSGITFTTALTKAHAIGAQVGGNGPTPGAPNQYARSTQRGRRGN